MIGTSDTSQETPGISNGSAPKKSTRGRFKDWWRWNFGNASNSDPSSYDSGKYKDKAKKEWERVNPGQSYDETHDEQGNYIGSSSNSSSSGPSSSFQVSFGSGGPGYGSGVADQYEYNKQLMYLQSQLNEAQAQRDFERAKKIQEYMMRLQFSLSSYGAQAARARAAGLNVGALFSNGAPAPSGDSGGSAPGGSGVGLGSVGVPNYASGSSPLDQSAAMLNMAKARQIEAQTPTKEDFRDNLVSETAQRFAAAGHSDASAALSRFDLSFKQAVFATEVEKAKQTLLQMRQDFVKGAHLIEGIKIANANAQKEGRNLDLDADIKKGVVRAQVADLYATFMKCRMMASDIDVNEMKIKHMRSDIALKLQQTVGQMVKNRQASSEYKDFLNRMRTPLRHSYDRFLEGFGSGIVGGTMKSILNVFMSPGVATLDEFANSTPGFRRTEFGPEDNEAFLEFLVSGK